MMRLSIIVESIKHSIRIRICPDLIFSPFNNDSWA
jgi:hypothetical protein